MVSKRCLQSLFFGLVVLAMTTLPLLAQQAGPYEIMASTIAAGGVQESAAGSYVVSSTSGQPEAGSMSGGAYEVNGGFWPSVVDPHLFSDGFEEGDTDLWSTTVGLEPPR